MRAGWQTACLALALLSAPVAAQEAVHFAPETASRPAVRPAPEPPGRPQARIAGTVDTAEGAAVAVTDTPATDTAESVEMPAEGVEIAQEPAVADAPAESGGEAPHDLRDDPPGDMRLAETRAVDRGRPLRLTVGNLLPPLTALGALDPMTARRMVIEGRLDDFFAPVGDGPAMSEPLAALTRLPTPRWEGPAPELRPDPNRPQPPGRPRARTESFETWATAWQARTLVIANATAEQLAEISVLAVADAVRPHQRRDDFDRVVAAAAPRAQTPRNDAGPSGGGTPRALTSGSGLCGVAILSGSNLGNIDGPGACGVEGAVEVTSVGGIRLSQGITTDCRTAAALADWVNRVANPAVGAAGGGLARLDVAGGYTCRGRNGVAGARLSEHAYGRAVDIMGFRLQDGTNLSVLNNWSNNILKAMHRGACGIFGTVLGPDANRYHRDHFHFDTARYRNGSYCR